MSKPNESLNEKKGTEDENITSLIIPEDKEYLEDIEYLQASTLKELEKKVRKCIEDYGIVEHNPFWDDQTKQWSQMVLYYNNGSEEEK